MFYEANGQRAQEPAKVNQTKQSYNLFSLHMPDLWNIIHQSFFGLVFSSLSRSVCRSILDKNIVWLFWCLFYAIHVYNILSFFMFFCFLFQFSFCHYWHRFEISFMLLIFSQICFNVFRLVVFSSCLVAFYRI